MSIILAIYIVSFILKTVYIENVFAVLIMGLILMLVNLLLKPILLAVALPFSIITFGLFSLVVNALTILIADGIVAGVSMGGFLNSLLTAVFVVVFNNLIIDIYYSRPAADTNSRK